MSSRAEQRALEVYPVEMRPLNYQDLIDQFGGKTEIDVNTYPRCIFQEGYEQAEKDLGWHPASEHPPVDEEVIVLTDILGVAPYYEIAVGHIIKEANIWNLRGVKWWMPMPKLPKEEEKWKMQKQ